ncbi:CinA family protein [Baekduia soli]|uniref:CinA family protein n=1 Tax=Baekduia soli TaxID=496014 RepID=A0A5B8U9R2_9ACTN|nr:CinA family protein [Baekduia soli]QEC49747.1 CinA family protein [Baekduia soli]
MLPATLTGPAATISERLMAAGQTVAVAESSAGGLISAALLAVPGASAYYRGGVVIYTLEGARALLAGATDLDPGSRGACEPFARYLSASAAARLDADWGVGETGATGPRGNRYGDPAGHAWVAVSGPAGHLDARHALTGSDDRAANMEHFAAQALTLLADALA